MSNTANSPAIVLADTITKLGPDAAGAVVVSGSHGGRYCAYLAMKAKVRAFMLNDAGVGKDRAGIASLALAEQHGVAAATLANTSCRIGDAADMMARGVVSHANAPARAAGVAAGMAGREAAEKLRAAPHVVVEPERVSEGRLIMFEPGWKRRIVLIDSASMILPEDAGQIIVTASHGGLLGGNPKMALQADGYAGVFNDAGVGIDGWGVTRLPALDSRGLAGITVAAASARIGEAASTFEDGVISHVNEVAARLGAKVGARLKPQLLEWVARA
jgi:hypothetical protein